MMGEKTEGEKTQILELVKTKLNSCLVIPKQDFKSGGLYNTFNNLSIFQPTLGKQLSGATKVTLRGSSQLSWGGGLLNGF